MNAKSFTIDFLDAKTNLPLATVRGRQAIWLMNHSGLLQNLRNVQKSNKGYTLDVNLPTDRALILQKLLRQQPLGFQMENDYPVEWYPVGPIEEAQINAHLRQRRLEQIAAGRRISPEPSDEEINEERWNVIYQVLTYLMLDQDVEMELIIIDEPQENTELARRNKVTRRRLSGPYEGLPFLNEDTIEDYIERHKNYLYSIYGTRPRNRGRLNTLLTRKNIANRNAKVNAWRRRTYTLNNNRPNNEHPFANVNMPSGLNTRKKYSQMSTLEFERYLRSLRGKAERMLPRQTNVTVGDFFGNPNNL